MVDSDKSTTTTSSGVDNVGPLGRRVLAYVETLQRIVIEAKRPGFTSAGWAPLTEYVAVDDFQRVGTFLEVMNWQQYCEMLTRWASATVFETTLHRISELPGLVYLEIEERHSRHDQVTVVNSMTVFDLDRSGMIRHLDVYLQRAG